MDGHPRQNPAYRPANEKALETGLFLLSVCAIDGALPLNCIVTGTYRKPLEEHRVSLPTNVHCGPSFVSVLGDPTLTNRRRFAACRPTNGLAPERRGSRRTHPRRGSALPERLASRAWNAPEVERLLQSKDNRPLPRRRPLRRSPRGRLGCCDQARGARSQPASVSYSGGWARVVGRRDAAGREAPETTRSSSTAEWLQQLLDGGAPGSRAPLVPTCSSTSTSGVPEEYQEDHPPWRPVPRHEPGRESGRLEPPDRRRSSKRRCAPLGSLARDHRHPLRAGTPRAMPTRSGRDGRAGQIAAQPRAALILRYKRRRRRPPCLDGGYGRLGPGGPPASKTVIRKPVPVASSGLQIPERPGAHHRPSTPPRRSSPDPEGGAIVSVRTWNEHIGKVSGYNYIGARGPDLPVTSGGNCGTDAYHMQH